MTRFARFALLLLAPALAARPAAAEPADAGAERAARRTYGLGECLGLAEQNHPNVWAARSRLDAMRAQLDEARFLPFSQFVVTAGVGPAPTVRGNALYSPNTETSLSSSMGIGWRVGIDGLIPLYTFGKMTNGWAAAEAQVKVGEADIAKQKNQVRLDVRRAYWGLLLARDGIALLDDALSQVKKALDHLHTELEGGAGDEIDQYKLETLRFELEARRSDARRYETMALAGLRFLTGVQTGFDVPDMPLRPIDRLLLPVAQYLTAARLHRPEVNMARAGIVARQALLDLAKSRYYPDFGIAFSAAWARAPEVDDQLNPFIRDDANYLRYGAVLGLRWTLDMLPNAARVAQARAQLEELRATERYALGGVGVEVETAYAQVVDAQTRARSYEAATKTARKWLIAVQQAIDVGTREDADLVEPARQWAQQRYNYLSALLDLNMAWANLQLATGWPGVLPDGS
jgi:outer membrane protein TolC